MPCKLSNEEIITQGGQVTTSKQRALKTPKQHEMLFKLSNNKTNYEDSQHIEHTLYNVGT